MIIRNERPEEYRAVEEPIKRAFRDANASGCSERSLK